MGVEGVTDRDRERFFGYHEECWKRNLTYKHAKRILAKTSMLTFRLDGCSSATRTPNSCTSSAIRSR